MSLAPRSGCSVSKRVKEVLGEYELDDVAVVDVNSSYGYMDFQDSLRDMTGQRTLPYVFVDGKHIGTDAVMKLHESGELKTVLQAEQGTRGGDPKMMAGAAEAQQLITDMTQQHDVTVFSKSTCPFCTRVKGMLDEYKLDDVAVVELNEREDGGEIQDTLLEMTGQRTVPNVFIGGKHIGGCDDTMKLHNDGELETLLKSAKGSRSGDPKMMAGYATYPGGALNVRRAGTTLNRRTCNGSAAVSSESHSWILEA